MKLGHCLLGLTMWAAMQVASAAELSSLKVLFVGSDPARIVLSEAEKSAKWGDRLIAMHKARTPAFEQLLRQHFKTVKVVYGPDFRENMSAGYDVTIFDTTPPETKPAVNEKAADGRPARYEPAHYLTARFSGAAILISDVSPKISEPLNYKMDWLCLCLDAHAHGMKLGHPIFNTPNKVKVTIEMRATPANYKQYYGGHLLADTLPMWRAQKEGYSDGKGFPAGLVSAGPGFEDGGDGEIISNGVCAKGEDAVALGRHGNFFHWGFSASPEDMTEEARLVFINSVHYIAGYKGQLPYSRRPYRATHGREWAMDYLYLVSQQRPRGEAQPASAAPNDTAAKIAFYEANLEYLRPAAGQRGPGGGYEVDEDVRSLAMSNRDPQILELCVAMLESNADAEKATRVLTRYTGEKFQTAKEWRQWLESSRGKLYFSDIDGFRFHVAPRALPR